MTFCGTAARTGLAIYQPLCPIRHFAVDVGVERWVPDVGLIKKQTPSWEVKYLVARIVSTA